MKFYPNSSLKTVSKEVTADAPKSVFVYTVVIFVKFQFGKTNGNIIRRSDYRINLVVSSYRERMTTK